MRRIAAIILVWALPTAAGAGAEAPAAATATANRLHWLAGCWESVTGEAVIRERWAPPAGGMLLGTSQTVTAGATTGWEFLRIEARPDALVYVAWPSGQAVAEFTATALDDSSVVFANPAHDFPQNIAYRRHPDGSVTARVAGPERAFTLVLRRVACE